MTTATETGTRPKRCRGCKRTLTFDDFSRNAMTGDGRESQCRDCMSAAYIAREFAKLHVCARCKAPKPFDGFGREAGGVRRKRVCRDCTNRDAAEADARAADRAKLQAERSGAAVAARLGELRATRGHAPKEATAQGSVGNTHSPRDTCDQIRAKWWTPRRLGLVAADMRLNLTPGKVREEETEESDD